MLALLGGCGTPGFRVEGMMASEGGVLGSWRWQPQGCIRASRVGEAVSDAVGVASLLWINPVRRDGSRANGNQFKVSDAPIRLDLARVGGKPIAVLETVRTQGTEFNRQNCGTLTFETYDEHRTMPEGRQALGGTLRMDCKVQGGHVTANVRFAGCDY